MSQNEKKGTRRKAYSSKKVVRRSPSCRTGNDGLENMRQNLQICSSSVERVLGFGWNVCLFKIHGEEALCCVLKQTLFPLFCIGSTKEGRNHPDMTEKILTT